MTFTLNEADVIDRIFTHMDAKTTDMGDRVWREPVDNYLALERFNAEIELLRRVPVPFCPSAALPEKGSYIARTAAQTPIVVVRGEDGIVRAFRNSCRHRGMKVATGSGCAGAVRLMRTRLRMTQNGAKAPLSCSTKLLPLGKCGISLKLECFSVD